MIKNAKLKITQSPAVSVYWSWYDQSQGIVQWTFQNNSDAVQSIALLRGAMDESGKVLVNYYFGNAYWAVYFSAGLTGWQTQNQQLQDQGVQNNVPPLAVLQAHGKYLVAFIFVLPPGATWSMLEGGFVNGIQPYNPVAIPAQYEGDHYFCIGYDPQQILDYEAQTGVFVSGYQPNPSTFKVSLYKLNGPYIELFDDTIRRGACPQMSWWAKIENFLKSSL